MYSVSVIKEDGPFIDLQETWASLLTDTPTDNIFLTHDWAVNWWRTFGHNHLLRIAVVTQDEIPVMIAPLMVTDDGAGRIQFIGTPDSDYADLIGKPSREACAALAEHLVEIRNQWNSIDLVQIPESSESLNFLKEALTAKGLAFTVSLSDVCYSFRYDGEPDERAEYKFSKPHSLRNSINRIKKQGDFSLERVTDPEQIKADLDSLFLLHVNRWQFSPTPSYFVEADYRKFFIGLVNSFAPTNRLCYYKSKVDNIPVCCFLGFEYQGRIVFYTFAHNNYFFKLSPGKLHAVVQSEELVRAGYDIDLSRGATEYKRMLSNRTADNLKLTVYGSSMARHKARLIPAIKKLWPVKQLLANRKFATGKDYLRLRIEQRGVVGTIGALLAALWHKIYKIEHVDIYKPGDSLPAVDSDIQLEAAWGNEDSLPLLATLQSISKDEPRYQQLVSRLEEKERFALVCYKGLPVATCWAKQLEHTHLLTDLYVHPLYGSETIAALLRFLRESLTDEIRLVLPDHEEKLTAMIRKAEFNLAQRQPTVYLFGNQIRRPD